MGYSCFTILCQFLLYNKVNKLYVYIYPLPLGSPLPQPLHPYEQFLMLYLGSICIIIYFLCYNKQLSPSHFLTYCFFGLISSSNSQKFDVPDLFYYYIVKYM